MLHRRLICMVLSCMLLVGSIAVPAYAVQSKNTSDERLVNNSVNPRATVSFNIVIPAKSQSRANSSFPLAAGETVTIKACYAPFSASVDFGLIAPDGTFYYFRATNVSIDKTIQVPESGEYILQIRNNASFQVEVSGFVNY